MGNEDIRAAIGVHEEWIDINKGRVYMAEKDTMWRREAIRKLKERMGEKEGD